MKKIITICIAILCLLSIARSIQEIYQLLGKRQLVTNLSHQLADLQAQQTQIKQQIKTTSTNDFIEEQARDKLFLSKPGETRVIVDANGQGSVAGISTKKPLSNFDQWLHVFNL